MPDFDMNEVAAEAKQIVAEAIKDAEQATGMTHEEFRERMEDERQRRDWQRLGEVSLQKRFDREPW